MNASILEKIINSAITNGMSDIARNSIIRHKANTQSAIDAHKEHIEKCKNELAEIKNNYSDDMWKESITEFLQSSIERNENHIRSLNESIVKFDSLYKEL